MRLISETTTVETRDGIRLATDVCRAESGPPRPVVLIRTPYLRAGSRQFLDLTGMVADGWSVVIQDTRGRGDSTGTGPLFAHEGRDGEDTLDWCVDQPWCDGRVVSIGSSYLGFAQWQMAASGHRALRAIAPMQAAGRTHNGFFYEGGAFKAGSMTQYAAVMAATDPSLSQADREWAAQSLRDPRALVATHPSVHPLRERYPTYNLWIDPDRVDYWDELNVSPTTAPMDVAGFHIAGWYDMFCDTTIALWRQLREQAGSEYARRSQRLTIGHWPHGVFLPSVAEVDYGFGSDLGSGAGGRMLPWLAAAINGEPVEDGVRAFVMGSNRWWDLPDWPPPSDAVELFLGSGEHGARSARGDGTLTSRPGPVGHDSFVHDPADPVPTRGGRVLGLARPLPGPSDQRDVEAREDVLVYSTEVLGADLTIAGPVRAVVTFATDAVTADVTVKLVDVHPDGRALNLLDTVQRQRFRPGVDADVELVLGTVAHTFLANHRIRIEVASSNAPHYDVNRSVDVRLDQPAAAVSAQQTVRHGGRTSSRLILPVVANLDGTSNTTALADGRTTAR